MTYVSGFLAAVPEARRGDYLALATEVAGLFRRHGALRVVETWGDNVPTGTVTDFRRAVAAGDGEQVVFSWIEWPDKATAEAAHAAMWNDGPPPANMPFDGKRLVWGGFEMILDQGERA